MTSASADKGLPPPAERISQPAPQIAWLSDGRAGHDRQSQALAQLLQRLHGIPGTSNAVAQITIPAPWRWAAPALLPGLGQVQTWPQFAHNTWLIGCGRRCAQALRYLRRQQREQIKSIQILDPRWARADFDLLLLPEHDRHPVHAGFNNIRYFPGSLHYFSWEALEQARQTWQRRWQQQAWPRPWLGVLIGNGGGRRWNQFWPPLAAALEQAMRSGGSILCTTSRRTPQHWLPQLSQQLAAWPGLCQHPDDHAQTNPYLGILSLCDELWVGGDSINMLSETLGCSQALRLASPPRREKHQQWVEQLSQQGLLLPLPPQGPAFPAPRRRPQANPAQQLAEQIHAYFSAQT